MSALMLLVALLLDFVLGDPAWGWHPVRVLGHITAGLEICCRGLPMEERAQGVVFLLLNLVVFMVPIGIILLIASFSRLIFVIVGGVFIYFALGGTCLVREVSNVANSLERWGPQEGRERLRMLVSRDVDGMGEEEIASSAIETLAENFSDSACATLFYAALGGPLLAWVHRIANTLDAMVGYKTEEYKDFGWASAKFDDLVNFIPARITAFLVALISPTIQGNVGVTIEQIRAGGASLPSPNSGFPIAAFAGALGVKLCGPTSYFGVVKEKPFIGIGPRPRIMDLMNALSLYWNAYAFASAAAVALGWLVSF